MRKHKLLVAFFVPLLLSQMFTPAFAYSRPFSYTYPSYPYAAYPYPPYQNSQPYTESVPPVTLYTWSLSMVSQRVISAREEGLDMQGTVPELSPDYGSASLFLNDMIDNAVNNRINMAKNARAKSISFEYKIYSDPQMVSVILLSKVTSATSKTEVDSVNFYPETGVLINSLSEVLSFDIIPLAEKVLKERIRRNPERYNAAFDTARLAEQPFYLENNTAVLLFDEFKLSSAADGVNELRFDLNRISHVSINWMEYHKSPVYNLKMVPLKRICEGLGYEVIWDELAGRANIYRYGTLVSRLKPGVNNYEETGERIRSLEVAPELMAGNMYVPISYFDQILSWITYTVDENENITFMSYVE